MYCVDDSLLLPHFDISLLMDPIGLPLQVINPERWDYYTAPDQANK